MSLEADELPFGDDEGAEEAPASGPRRTTAPDGAIHFSQLKRMALSGKQYLHACNARRRPTPAMLLGTAVHEMVLGARAGSRVIRYPGASRKGAAWKVFAAQYDGADILTEPEWERAAQIAASVRADPVAREWMAGARFEVPLRWEEDGLRLATGGVDILTPDDAIGDLKTTTTCEPEALQRQAFEMLYHCQLALYRRGARACGWESARRPFLVCVETAPPFEVVVLELSEQLTDLGDRTVSLWIERLKTYLDADQWPGYAQAPIPWDVPGWMQGDDDE